MNLTEHSFDELSALKYRIFTTPLPNALDQKALIVAFEGDYGLGCKGNEDAEFIDAIIAGAQIAWEYSFFVLDYRSMTYEWGDRLPLLTGQKKLASQEEELAHIFGGVPACSATLISSLNQEAIHSLIASDYGLGLDLSWLFSDLEEAVAAFEDVWRQLDTKAGAL